MCSQHKLMHTQAMAHCHWRTCTLQFRVLHTIWLWLWLTKNKSIDVNHIWQPSEGIFILVEPAVIHFYWNFINKFLNAGELRTVFFCRNEFHCNQFGESGWWMKFFEWWICCLWELRWLKNSFNFRNQRINDFNRLMENRSKAYNSTYAFLHVYVILIPLWFRNDFYPRVLRM